jgi:hypothetical protein
MRSVIWIGLILALVLGLLLSAISCNTVYIPATPTPTPRLTPKPTPTPIPALTPTPTYGNRPVGEGIAQFLNDNHINSVLWEEWNIFDE